MTYSHESALDRLVDVRNVSYFEARQILDAETGAAPVSPAPAEEADISVPFGEYDPTPPFVARTPAEQAEQDAINVRGRALAQAALDQLKVRRGEV